MPTSDEDAALARTVLSLATTMHMFKVVVPQDPNVKDSDCLLLKVGHWTCTCPAFDKFNNKVIMFQDSWCMMMKDVLPEGQTYKLLKYHNVHDVIHPIPQQDTQTVKYGNAEWACPNNAVTPHTLHHLVFNLVVAQSVHNALLVLRMTWNPVSLMYRESHMTVIDQTQFIMQIFNADMLVGSGGCTKSNWLVVRTDFPQDIFVNCKLLDNLILELAQFFSHQYSIITPEAQEKLV
ncbi:hypothetical protein BDR06DRAFT_977614 [Suillus hirtellus]|nr:hypothetical protein BDR06DRAFT_977614 [Suillus hirtellus]